MAAFTVFSKDEARSTLSRYGLGDVVDLVAIEAGSVNSNYAVRTTSGRYFVRIYEAQEEEGVAFETALLQRLHEAGVPVACPLPYPGSAMPRIADKPLAVFPWIVGVELCQAMTQTDHTIAVGSALARAHLATTRFPGTGANRFDPASLAERLEWIAGLGRADLATVIPRLRTTLAEVAQPGTGALPSGVIHGDLFRDNVRFTAAAAIAPTAVSGATTASASEIAALLDWESAGHGAFAYDLMVTMLAFCYGDDLDWGLARGLTAGYRMVRKLEVAERAALWSLARLACVRFCTTRITDFHLRPEQPRHRDYRRFLARLDRIEGFTAPSFAAALLD